MNQKFDYKELDHEGYETLEAISEADKFNGWMFDTIRPWCKGRVLEIGSGIGNISSFFLDNNYQICLSDIRDNYCDVLRERFADSANLIGVEKIDIVHPDFDVIYKHHFESFDTAFALNVVEHIENDALAIANTKKLLKKDGNLIILVPAYQALYNKFDEELYHFRRYNKKSLTQLMNKAGLTVASSFYFNAVGIIGWFFSGKLQKNKTIPKGQMKLYNSLVPIIKLMDKILIRQIGLSVVAVGRK